MSVNGVYGTNVGALIDSNDVDIFYSYSPTRNCDDINNLKFNKLESGNLVNAEMQEKYGDAYSTQIEGLYNLKLPLQYFNQKGFYTIYIKPRESKKENGLQKIIM